MRRQVIAFDLVRLAKWVVGFVVLNLVAAISEPLIFAHTTSISYSEIQIKEKTVQVRLRLNLYEVSFAAQLDGNSDKVLSEKEVSSSFPKWVHRVFDNIQIEGQGQPGKASLSDFRFTPDTGALECLLSYAYPEVLEDVRFRVTLHNLTDSGHLNLALIQYDSQQEQRFFNLESTDVRIELHRSSLSVLRLWTRWLLIGGRRVINSYECIAFLLGLFLVNQSLKNQTRVTVAFVLSQTVTFLVGALNFAVLPQKFVGSAIALSVAYISIENLLIKEVSNRWLIALFFGLIYGFSFSSTTAEWGVSQKGRLFSLLTISLGITLVLSSLVVLVCMLLRYLSRLRFSSQIMTLASLILMTFGFFAFATRTF